MIPSGPKFIREREEHKHLLRERGKGWGLGRARGWGNSEGHGRGQVQEGPRHLGDPYLWCPKLRRGVMSTLQHSGDDQGKSTGVVTPGDIPSLRPLQNKHHQLPRRPLNCPASVRRCLKPCLCVSRECFTIGNLPAKPYFGSSDSL